MICFAGTVFDDESSCALAKPAGALNSEREVNERLGRIMRKAFREVSERAADCGIPMRAAAYELGIERVVEASRTRGYIS